MEGIKAKLQVQYAATSSSSGTGGSAGGAAGAGGRQYKGPVDCFLKVLRQQGLQKGIYRGWLPVVASRMSNYSYFGGQVFFSGLIASGVGVQLDQGEQLPVGYSLISGGLAGCTYWWYAFNSRGNETWPKKCNLDKCHVMYVSSSSSCVR
jgi:hypothetical protein